MDPFLRVIRNSQLFSGITEEELREMLGCLDVRRKRFQKGDFIFRTGDVTESLGLLLSGRALVLQDDFWGNRNLFSTVTQGHTFAETFACAAGTAMTVSVLADSDCEVLFLNVKRILTVCPTACSHHSRVIRNLLADMAGKNLACNEKLLHMAQRTTRAKLLSYFPPWPRNRTAPGSTSRFPGRSWPIISRWNAAASRWSYLKCAGRG